ncbi:OLC1v1021326C1 [Oldenlandia corymbosa var. corymbosa]|uniref:OLC1v1021326C1 n=1 Tax=Oldenlandia corymbosa var. corymbosa TaxID=529605 RepID=A0AAV1BVF1_OLDCO|nr:OLC1v1021326C1 [Oldenlandia corymbosa var. corymbosa]
MVRMLFSVVSQSGRGIILQAISCIFSVSRSVCSRPPGVGGEIDNGCGTFEDYLNDSWKSADFDGRSWEEREKPAPSLEFTEGHFGLNNSIRSSFMENVRNDAKSILEILWQDGPGFDARAALDGLEVRLSGLLVRQVLLGILTNMSDSDKTRSARLGYKFFVWSGQRENYRHTTNAYHLIMEVFAEAEEFKAMWRLLEDMIDKGYPTSARTFNILICTCGEAGLARKVVERFIKTKTFNFRPFKHCFNAILHSLITIRQYKLIEWVYEQMLVEGHSPDVLTYNIVLCSKYRLGKLDQFQKLLDEMDKNGFPPDLHTYNLLLHVLGRGGKPLSALKLLNHMKDVGCQPTVLHFTTLIDGLSRAGNMDACKHFFDEMIKQGCMPDVVSYTVMITGYVVAGEFDTAQELFDEMIRRGQLPNVFTYNSMIRGLCMAGKFEEACLMLREMDSRGCNPNFLVYSTLVGYLRNAGKLSKAHSVINIMVEKGHYVHLLSKMRRYRRC